MNFTAEQRKLILQTCCSGASESEATALMAIAEQRGLNPITGECFFVKRKQKNPETEQWEEKWAVQAGIDSFRAHAEGSGQYDGQDEPEYEHNDAGEVTLARVRVWRKDISRPFVGVARWAEYVQTTRDGKPTRFWAKMPYGQLAKCAEALAFRKAFPQRFAKVYAAEEMDQASNEERLPAAKAARTLPPHDPTTGELPHKPANGGPRVLSDEELVGTYAARKAQILEAPTVEVLRFAWLQVNADVKSGRLTKDQRTALRKLLDQRKGVTPSQTQREPADAEPPADYVSDGQEDA